MKGDVCFNDGFVDAIESVDEGLAHTKTFSNYHHFAEGTSWNIGVNSKIALGRVGKKVSRKAEAGVVLADEASFEDL